MRVGEREFRVNPSPGIRTLAEARAALAGKRVWLVTDGKMGDLAPGLGLTERLGIEAESRVVAPRKLFAAFMPWGPIDPREAPSVAARRWPRPSRISRSAWGGGPRVLSGI